MVYFALLLQECSTFGDTDCKLSFVVNEGAADRPAGFNQVSAQGSAVFQTIFRPSLGGCGGHVPAIMPTFLFSSSSTLGFPGQV